MEDYDPQDAKKLDRNVEKAINCCADYFGKDDFLKRESPVLCLEEGKEEKKLGKRDVFKFNLNNLSEIEQKNLIVIKKKKIRKMVSCCCCLFLLPPPSSP